MSANWVSSIIGLALAGAILYLVRRDRLHGPYALWWLLVAAATLLAGLFPALVNWLGRVTGVYYPPILPIIVAIALMLLRLLQLDIGRSQQERRLRRLVQKVAMLELELTEMRDGEKCSHTADISADPVPRHPVAGHGSDNQAPSRAEARSED